MKACANEKRLVKKGDLEKMKKQMVKSDRKEDDKRYVRKTVKGKK